MTGSFVKYGLNWPAETDPVEIERFCIRKGGRWTDGGKERGIGLFEHYKSLFTLLWPEDHHNRWSDMILESLLKERLTVIQGPKNSQKTRTVGKWALCKYWCFPHDTLVLMTSTDRRGLQLRIWGDIKSLFERARTRCSWLEGSVVDASDGIFTDDILNKGGSRDMRKGIIGVPTVSSTGDFLGMALKNFAGIKQTHRILVGDELQFIPVEYLKVLDSLDDGDFAAAFMLNPIANNGKAGDRVAEPVNGWSSLGEVTKTTSWRNKYGGVTIQLVGPDSPNFDKPLLRVFPNLIGPDSAERVAARPGGKDSLEWWSLIMGIRKAGVVSNKVLTVEMIERLGGFGPCTWSFPPMLKILAIDAGFGGDPCMVTYAECGEEVGGANVMLFAEQEVIPIELSIGLTPEKQIANWVLSKCGLTGTSTENVFVECGMRATLGVEMALVVGTGINAVNAGGPATNRPVNNDLLIDDKKTGQKRPKTCYEHYSKFVTEMAFSVRELVESGQSRGFPRLAAEEFERREWSFVYGDRYEIETKDKYKARNAGESPNCSDSIAIAVEGARRRGFQIARIKDGAGKRGPERDWLDEEMQSYKKIERERELQYD